MTRLFKVMAMLLALLWVPLVSHCDLEHLPGMAFIACCDLPDAEPHQDKDCQTDICASVESGQYKTEDQDVTVPLPSMDVAARMLLATPVPDDFCAVVVSPSTVPIDLPQRWHFISRAALPVRAPSLVS